MTEKQSGVHFDFFSIEIGFVAISTKSKVQKALPEGFIMNLSAFHFTTERILTLIYL